MDVIDVKYASIPIKRQCELLDLGRSSLYYRSHSQRALNEQLMRLMGLEAVYQKPRMSQRNPQHKVYPYLLRDVTVERPDQVWCTDLTYIPMRRGWVYLVTILDWFSRYVLAWEISVTLDTSFCISALQRALVLGTPEIFNSD